MPEPAPVVEGVHVPALLLVGLAVVAGAFGARLFRRLRIPQVVGYIAIGILVGDSGLGIIGPEEVRAFTPVTFFALGVIGFLIGSELSRDVFRRHGKKFFLILVSEGMGAFLLVGAAAGAVTYAVTGDAAEAAALGLLLGAMASATAPAATVDVLWEYKTRGPLTTNVLAIVALDDALSLFLFSLASGTAVCLLGGAGASLLRGLGRTGYELGGAVVLGAVAGLGLNFILRRTREADAALTYLVGMLALVLGVSLLAEVDVILASMMLGMVMVNLAPRHIESARQAVERFAQPIFVLFFVIVGAKLSLRAMPAWFWALAGAYVVGRTAGKMTGAWFGARLARAPDAVRRYLGLCLFSQAGVAIGLSIVAGTRFADQTVGGEAMGTVIVSVIAATTFLVQIIGPPMVKLAAVRAGEVGRNVTEEDLINTYRVEDVFDHNLSAFNERTPLAEVLRVVTEDDAPCHMVTDADGRIVGMITLDVLKESWQGEGLADWLVAFDVMAPAPDPVTGDMPLSEALARLNRQGLDCLPVADARGRYLGVLLRQDIAQRIRSEILRRSQEAAA